MDPITSKDRKSVQRPSRIDLGGSTDTVMASEDISSVAAEEPVATENVESMSCAACGQQLRVRAGATRIRCPKCQHQQTVSSSAKTQGDTGRLDTAAPVTDGKELAAALAAAGYHPVIVFGNANSGKTLLLLSLLALIKTESRLKIGLRLGEPLLDITTPGGQAAWTHAEEIFGRQTQLFIDGTLPPATAVRDPFFVPLVLSPSEAAETKIALLESNGEWYAPEFDAGRLFPPLRKQIEQFILHFEGAMSFLHVVPRTQTDGSYGAIAEDVKSIASADLAIVGALHQYAKLRSDKSQDMHLLLVSKWDAHADTRPGVSVEDVLQKSDDDVLDFVSKYCPQSYAALTGLLLRPEQVRLSAYCSARIVDKQKASLSRRTALIVQSYHEHLWNWVYRNASGGTPLFRPSSPSIIDRIINWIIGQ